MYVQELMNFLPGVDAGFPVVVRDANGNLVEAYYEYLTSEDPGGPAILIKAKHQNL